MEEESQNWSHPGGKLRELVADKLTDAELLSILIAPGVKGLSAEKIAEEILQRFGSFRTTTIFNLNSIVAAKLKEQLNQQLWREITKEVSNATH